MPTVRKIADPDDLTTDDRRPTTDDRVATNGHSVALQAGTGFDALPQEWTWTTFGEIVRVTRHRANPQEYAHLSYIGLEHLEAHSMRLLGTVPATEMRSNAEHFWPGDVLYGRLRPYLNKVFHTNFEGLCSAEFIVFRQNDYLDSRYLQYFLNSWDFVTFATHLNAGDRPRVDFEQIADYPFPLPPLAEQRRIVEAIEQQLTRLDAGVASLRRAQAGLRRYKATVLKAACEGRLVPQDPSDEPADALLRRILCERRAKWEAEQIAKMQAQGRMILDDGWRAKYQEPQGPDMVGLQQLPQGWVWATVDQLAAHEPSAVTDGPFGSNLKTEHYTESGPRVIRLQNISDGEFVNAEAHISQQHFETLQRHRIFAGDLVIAALGETLPRACIIPEALGSAIVKADCIRFKPHTGLAIVKYLNAAPNSDVLKRAAARIIHGIGRPRLNQQEVKSLPTPLPPLAEQQRIVAEVERRLSVVAEVEAAVAANLKRAERLRQAILKRAFEGKLVPQDPSDEPASVLLERIRRGRESRAENQEPGKARRRHTSDVEQLRLDDL